MYAVLQLLKCENLYTNSSIRTNCDSTLMHVETPNTMESDLNHEFPSNSQSLFDELKQEDIIIPLTYVTLKTQVQVCNLFY